MTSFTSSHTVAQATSITVPLICDLDGTLLSTDTLDETWIRSCFRHPLGALSAVAALLFGGGVAPFKSKLAALGLPDVAVLPVRPDVLEYLKQEKRRHRPLYLATAADRQIADAVAAHLGLFNGVYASEDGVNFRGETKGQRLSDIFPSGFAYIGDSRVDLPVWRAAAEVLAVDNGTGLSNQLRREKLSLDKVFCARSGDISDWARALRTHQWSKNVLVLVPVLLAWSAVTAPGLAAAAVAMLLLCALASLTYILNDLADLDADRRHWSKRNRPFASGALTIRQGMLAVTFGLPLIMGAALALSTPVFIGLFTYLIVTLAYSFGAKRIPLFDTFIIAVLFTLRLVIGIAAVAVVPSPWLFAFAMFFFFSLATAKRHAELLRMEEMGQVNDKVSGRGYHVADKDATLIFGIASGLISVNIMIQFLMHEIMTRPLYGAAPWMWGVPPMLFLWLARIWLLAHRGQMADDPVVFAIRDPISIQLGALVASFFLLAVLL